VSIRLRAIGSAIKNLHISRILHRSHSVSNCRFPFFFTRRIIKQRPGRFPLDFLDLSASLGLRGALLVECALFLCDDFTPLFVGCVVVDTRITAGRASAVPDSEPVSMVASGKKMAVGHGRPLEVRSALEAHLIAGFSQLLRAFDYATDAGREVWEFAIELSELREVGMTTCDFRWLVSKGFAEHGRETSLYDAPQRSFCRGKGLTFVPTTAVVLTPLGAAELRKLLVSPVLPDLPPSVQHTATSIMHGTAAESRAYQATLLPIPPEQGETAAECARRPTLNLKPIWDSRRRELRVGELVVKKFRVPAENQELILSAFEEDGWPEYVDDPLPRKPSIVPKLRLHNAINRLNGRQLAPLLRFHGNGNGNAIGWTLCREVHLDRS
jgi:hypothetical protein